MNFQQLEYALAVHRHKHFGRAAESCHVAQATLSAMIQKLEKELNVILFDRSKKPILTTDAGDALLKKAKDIIVLRDELYALNDQGKKLGGELRLGIIPTIASTLLPLFIQEVQSDHPDLRLRIFEITTEEIKQQLTMDRIDVGILATPLSDDRFEESILYYEPMMVYGVKDSKKKYISTKEIRTNKIWLLEEGHCFRNQTMTICEIKEKTVNDSNFTFKGSSFETLLGLTDSFGGYTLIPELYFKTMPESRKKKTRPFQKPLPVREISLVTYRHESKRKAIEYLSGLIQDKVEGLLSTDQFKNSDLEIIGI